LIFRAGVSLISFNLGQSCNHYATPLAIHREEIQVRAML
jgi:hypothetical protein